MAACANNLGEASSAVLFSAEIKLVRDAVRIEHHRVAGLCLEFDLVVFAVFQQAQRHAFDAELEDLAVSADHRRQRAGVGHAQLACVRMPEDQQ